MPIDVIPSRNSRPVHLLRQSGRDGRRVSKRTPANPSKLPLKQIETIRRELKRELPSPGADGLEVTGPAHHGHAEAVRNAI